MSVIYKSGHVNVLRYGHVITWSCITVSAVMNFSGHVSHVFKTNPLYILVGLGFDVRLSCRRASWPEGPVPEGQRTVAQMCVLGNYQITRNPV